MSNRTDDFTLNIYNESNIFQPGDIVRGFVTLNNMKNLREVELISIQAIGISKAQWTRSSPTIPYIKIYKEKRQVLNITIELYKKSSIDMLRDKYEFQFFFPSDLPPTFKSSIGKVYYNLTIVIKSTKLNTLQKIIPLTVIKKLDLNYSEVYMKVATYDFHHTFWNSKSVSITVKTYKGCATGQKLPIKIMLLNNNSVKLKSFTVNLLQTIEYVLIAGHAEKQKSVSFVKSTSFLGKFVENCDLELEIPQTHISTTETDNYMINVSYVLRFAAVFPYYFTAWADYPITIGSVPIRYYINNM